MTRFLFPLILLALAVCALIAYARLEAQDAAEWRSTMDEVPRQMEAAR